MNQKILAPKSYWYGPAGIGTGRGMQVSDIGIKSILRAMPDRKGGSSNEKLATDGMEDLKHTGYMKEIMC